MSVRRGLVTAGVVIYVAVGSWMLFTGGPPADVGKGVNVTPFQTITHSLASGSASALLLLLANLALLMPVGVLLALRRPRLGVGPVLALLVTIAAAIEILQYLLPGARSVDVDDLILNVAGGCVAYALYALVSRVLTRRVGGLPTEPATSVGQ